MTLRLRISLAVASAAALAVVLAALLTFVLVERELTGRVDRSLRDRGGEIARAVAADPSVDPVTFLPRPLGPRFGGPVGLAQIVERGGRTVRADTSGDALPVDATATAIARDGGARLESVRVDGIRVRVLALGLGDGRALLLARPLDEVDASLATIRDLLAAIALGGLVLGGVLGLLVARRVLVPVRRLAEVVDHVTRTRDLDRRVELSGRDELARLGDGMNLMLDAVDDAAAAQRRLVADVSHELRTPLTSLRADIGLLRRSGDVLEPDDRRALIDGLDARLAEMSDLVRELMELAEGDLAPPPFAPVRLDHVLEDAIARLRRHRPDATVAAVAEPVTVLGAAPLLERAVANLLDNAAKWSPPDAPIEVALAGDGSLRVSDHGPGIAAADLPRIFERFYRADAARDVPGFGLGLAIVRRVADAHGGSVQATSAPGAGASFVLALPVVPV